MSWGPLLVNLAVTAGIVAVLMLATFFYAMRTRVHAIVDTVWPLGFVIIALVSFGLSAGHGLAARRVLVLVLAAVWGLRLGAHIYLRNAGQGEDKRYASLLRRNRGSLAAFVLRYIYWAQGRVMWFGFWLLACSHWLGLLLVASPVYMTNMLVRHTGKRLLEKHMARSKGAAYADYVRRTSGFIPWPPR
jgi:steroid 5-alpha reductase family enzyme